MDVATWLRGLGLERHEAAFRDNLIDMDVVPELTENDLEKLGLALGDRRRVLKAIAGLPPLAAATSVPIAAPRARDEAERRPVTVMFCDLVGSTSLAATLDAEDWRDLVGAYLDDAAKAVARYGGHVAKRLGDGLMALFGYPKAQENDAERAARAGLAILRAIADLNAANAGRELPKLSARIGLDSGPVIVDSAGDVFGDAPNVAARVQSVAQPGTLLVTATVRRQVAGLFIVEEKGPYELKGVPGAPTLYRIARASGGGRRAGARAYTPLIGREDDLGVLLKRWERARAGEGQFIQIDPVEVMNASVRFRMNASSKLKVKAALAQGGIGLLLQSILNPEVDSIANQQGMRLDFSQIQRLINDTFGLAPMALWVQMTPQEQQALMQQKMMPAMMKRQEQQDRLDNLKSIAEERDETTLIKALLEKLMTPQAAHALLDEYTGTGLGKLDEMKVAPTPKASSTQ